MIDMDADGAVAPVLLPLKPRRELRTLKGTLREILNAAPGQNKEDYLRIVLTDEGELLEPMAKLRQVYPNVMALELQRDLNTFFKPSSMGREARLQKTAQELFGDFYEHHRGEHLEEMAVKVIHEIVAGLQEEA
jgi:exonuclease SbcD